MTSVTKPEIDLSGLQFNDPSLKLRALTHKSYHNENPDASKGHNERLEFLGDAVLELFLSEILFLEHPNLNEGQMSKVRASLVNEKSLAELSVRIGLSEFIRFGKGEIQTGGALKPRLLACALEALIGAVYLDQGPKAAQVFVTQLFKDRMASAVDTENYFGEDYKTRLQEMAQEKWRRTPVYEHLGAEGPDHEKTFKVRVSLDNEKFAYGEGRSKKQAEQNAAAKALQELI